MKKIIITLCVTFFLLVNIGVGFASNENNGKINLNTATKEQLIELGLDEETADAILELRKENDEFVDMDELLDVDGIDAKMIRQLKKKLYIEAAKGCNC